MEEKEASIDNTYTVGGIRPIVWSCEEARASAGESHTGCDTSCSAAAVAVAVEEEDEVEDR